MKQTNIALDNGQPIVVYHDLANIWSCDACPSVTFHLYTDGKARCISCGLIAPEFISAYPDLHAARQRIKFLQDELFKADLALAEENALIKSLANALLDLIVIFDTHPHLPCEDGELPALDRARAVYAKTCGCRP